MANFSVRISMRLVSWYTKSFTSHSVVYHVVAYHFRDDLCKYSTPCLILTHLYVFMYENNGMKICFDSIQFNSCMLTQFLREVC